MQQFINQPSQGL